MCLILFSTFRRSRAPYAHARMYMSGEDGSSLPRLAAELQDKSSLNEKAVKAKCRPSSYREPTRSPEEAMADMKVQLSRLCTLSLPRSAHFRLDTIIP